MILHLLWLLPALLFLILFLTEPRRLINAYLFLITSILFILTISGYFVVQIENWDKQLALTIFIIGILLIPIGMIASTIYLLFNGKQMMNFEGMRIANLLSLFYGIAILISFLLHLFSSIYWINTFSLLVDFFLLYGTFLYLSYISYSLFYNLFPLTYQPDYIIVLGSGLVGDKIPPLLAQRLEKGLLYYRKYNQQPTIIVSGGQGSDETISEAQAMANYLIQKGLPQDKLLLEDQSTTTYENLLFSKRLLGEHTPKKPSFLVVTNSFHSLRAGIYMRQLRLRGRSIGSKTAFYYLPSAWIRETAGLCLLYWKWHAIIIGLHILSWITTFLF